MVMSYLGPGFRRGMGGLCLMNPADGQMEDSETGGPCVDSMAANISTLPISSPSTAALDASWGNYASSPGALALSLPTLLTPATLNAALSLARGVPCLAGSGPLQPGQSYCYGNTPSGVIATPATGGRNNLVIVGLAAAAVGLLFLGLSKR
jgi:hypothetical protein